MALGEPKIEKSEGIIINSKSLHSTSKLLTVFTKDFGKILIEAKGARRKKSVFSGIVEKGNFTELVFYKRMDSDFYLLKESYLYNDFNKIKNSVNKYLVFETFLYFIENFVKYEDNQYHSSYKNILRAAALINNKDIKENFLYFLIFALDFLKESGILLNRFICTNCFTETKLHINHISGEIFCSRCIEKKESTKKLSQIGEDIIQILNFLIDKEISDQINLKIKENQKKNLFKFLNLYFEIHFQREISLPSCLLEILIKDSF